mgnify:CR=1 FL=1
MDVKLYAFADEACPEMDGQIAAMLRNGLDGIEIRGVDGETISDIVLRGLLERIFDDDAKLYEYEVARDRYKENPTEENLAELHKHFWWRSENKNDI